MFTGLEVYEYFLPSRKLNWIFFNVKNTGINFHGGMHFDSGGKIKIGRLKEQ